MSPDDEYTSKQEETALDMTSIELAIRQDNAVLKTENKRLHDSLNGFHEKYQSLASEVWNTGDFYNYFLSLVRNEVFSKYRILN